MVISPKNTDSKNPEPKEKDDEASKPKEVSDSFKEDDGLTRKERKQISLLQQVESAQIKKLRELTLSVETKKEVVNKFRRDVTKLQLEKKQLYDELEIMDNG